MEKLINWIMENPQYRFSILVALIGTGGVVIGALLNSLFLPWFKTAIERLWEKLEKRFSTRTSLNNYLDWLIHEHKYLPILPSTLVPVTKVDVQELDKLYVSLSISTDESYSRESSLGEALRESPRIVIIGDPGAGKTTMLRFLALTFARAKRQSMTIQKNTKRNREVLKTDSSKERVRKEFGYKDYPLPIFIYLNKLRDVGSWPSGRSILDAFKDEIKSSEQLRVLPENFFEEKLKRGQCLFLLDAFDELGTKEARAAIAEHIGHLSSAAPEGNRFILTSRIVGYDGQLSKHGFKTLKVQRLSKGLIVELITKWYESLDEIELINPLIASMESNPRLYDLALNPMLLSLIVLVQYVKRIIPDKRHLLYDECIKILVERRYASPLVQRAFNEILPGEDATSILQEIALEMHKESIREITRLRLQREIIPKILKQMTTRPSSKVAVSEIIKNIEERSQLLVERGLDETGEPLMAFSHLTFQEYLASVSLIEKVSLERGKGVNNQIINWYKKDHEWWEEVAVLYAAQLNNDQRHSFLNLLYPKLGNEQ